MGPSEKSLNFTHDVTNTNPENLHCEKNGRLATSVFNQRPATTFVNSIHIYVQCTSYPTIEAVGYSIY